MTAMASNITEAVADMTTTDTMTSLAPSTTTATNNTTAGASKITAAIDTMTTMAYDITTAATGITTFDSNIAATTADMTTAGQSIITTTFHATDATAHSQTTTEFYDYNEYDGYDSFIYPGYPFERPVYMYVWGILVLITFLANIMVIFVLLQKKMRNPTNMILAAIAISDSLTGLVTLPTYWMVYAKFNEPPEYNDNYGDYNYTTPGNVADTGIVGIANTTSDYMAVTANAQNQGTPGHDDYGTAGHSDYITIPFGPTQAHLTPNGPNQAHTTPIVDYDSQDGYFISQSLCRAFMISKYFLSKTFHAVSIWLTLFLGFQRFISVASPFRAQKLFCERNVVIICCVIAVLAPVLHIYHLVDEKADSSKGMCQWDLEEDCGGGCAYLVLSFLLRHCIPCVLLVVFTVLFIQQLTKSSSRLSRIDSNRGNASMQHRDSENRRVSLIVTLIVIVFLIPELPYGAFLLYALIAKLRHIGYDLESNRAVHMVYELSLVLSFHANFYIYTFFNKRFRKHLLKVIVVPILTCFGKVNCFGLKSVDLQSKSSFSSSRRRTLQSETGTRIELRNIRRSSSSAGKSTSITEANTVMNGGKPHENGHDEEMMDEKSKCLPEDQQL